MHVKLIGIIWKTSNFYVQVCRNTAICFLYDITCLLKNMEILITIKIEKWKLSLEPAWKWKKLTETWKTSHLAQVKVINIPFQMACKWSDFHFTRQKTSIFYSSSSSSKKIRPSSIISMLLMTSQDIITKFVFIQDKLDPSDEDRPLALKNRWV